MRTGRSPPMELLSLLSTEGRMPSRYRFSRFMTKQVATIECVGLVPLWT